MKGGYNMGKVTRKLSFAERAAIFARIREKRRDNRNEPVVDPEEMGAAMDDALADKTATPADMLADADDKFVTPELANDSFALKEGDDSVGFNMAPANIGTTEGLVASQFGSPISCPDAQAYFNSLDEACPL